MRLIKIFLLAAGALVVSVVGVRAVHACTALLKPVDQVIRERYRRPGAGCRPGDHPSGAGGVEGLV